MAESKKLNHIICIDFETGGTDPAKDAVTEVGMVAYRADTFEVIDTYQAYIKPFYTKKKAVKALKSKKRIQEELFKEEDFHYDWDMMKKYTNITQELLEREGKDIRVVAEEMEQFFRDANLDKGNTTKPVLLGQNVLFDIGFLQQMEDVAGLPISKVLSGKKDFHGNFQPDYLCTLQQAKLLFANDESQTSHKLGHLCEAMGIELFEAHSALDDVHATGDLEKVIVNRMRNGTGAGSEKKKTKTRNHFKF
jgi:DNA polymerase III epsilon subunit-like protein